MTKNLAGSFLQDGAQSCKNMSMVPQAQFWYQLLSFDRNKQTIKQYLGVTSKWGEGNLVHPDSCVAE